jgi:hypothetical protein
MTLFGMMVGQIGTAFADRTAGRCCGRPGVFANRLLPSGIAFELVLAAALTGLPTAIPVPARHGWTQPR